MGNQKTSQLELIKNLLSDDYLQKDKFAKILVEKDLMKRDIVVHNGIEYLLYKYETNGKIKLFPYFKDHSGLKKICDYFLFVEEGKHLYLLLIELKCGTESATNQLLASECFAEYLIKSMKRLGFEITDNFHIRKIRVSEERAKKRNRKTKATPLEYDINKIINYDHSDVFRIKEVLEIVE